MTAARETTPDSSRTRARSIVLIISQPVGRAASESSDVGMRPRAGASGERAKALVPFKKRPADADIEIPKGNLLDRRTPGPDPEADSDVWGTRPGVTRARHLESLHLRQVGR